MERIGENCEDPELKDIENLLEKSGYCIVAPEHERNKHATNARDGYEIWNANIYLADAKGKIVNCRLMAKMKKPIPDSASITREDEKFLKRCRLIWQP